MSDSRYDELLNKRFFEVDPNFRWCSNALCGAGHIIDGGGNPCRLRSQLTRFFRRYLVLLPAASVIRKLASAVPSLFTRGIPAHSTKRRRYNDSFQSPGRVPGLMQMRNFADAESGSKRLPDVII